MMYICVYNRCLPFVFISTVSPCHVHMSFFFASMNIDCFSCIGFVCIMFNLYSVGKHMQTHNVSPQENIRIPFLRAAHISLCICRKYTYK